MVQIKGMYTDNEVATGYPSKTVQFTKTYIYLEYLRQNFERQA